MLLIYSSLVKGTVSKNGSLSFLSLLELADSESRGPALVLQTEEFLGEFLCVSWSWRTYTNPETGAPLSHLGMVRQEVGGSHPAVAWAGGRSMRFSQVDPDVLKAPHVLGWEDLCRKRLWGELLGTRARGGHRDSAWSIQKCQRAKDPQTGSRGIQTSARWKMLTIDTTSFVSFLWCLEPGRSEQEDRGRAKVRTDFKLSGH